MCHTPAEVDVSFALLTEGPSRGWTGNASPRRCDAPAAKCEGASEELDRREVRRNRKVLEPRLGTIDQLLLPSTRNVLLKKQMNSTQSSMGTVKVLVPTVQVQSTSGVVAANRTQHRLFYDVDLP